MELRHLKYFVAAAEEGSVTKAAQRLHVAQPPISRQLHDLEAEIGVPCFRRIPRGLALTAAGERLLNEARAILARTDQLRDSVHRAARGECGRLALSYVPALSHGFVPTLLRHFRACYPEVEISLEDLGPAEQVTRLLDNRVDLAFTGQAVALASEQLAAQRIRTDPFGVVLWPGHRLSKK